MEKYDRYSFEDFLEDDDLRAFVRSGEPAAAAVWAVWLRTDPSNRQAYAEAVEYLGVLYSARRIEPSPAFSRNLWENIGTGIAHAERRRAKVRVLRLSGWVAAASLVLALSGLWYWQSIITVRTGNAEWRTVVLPDQSEVTLNANSSLSYHRAWRWRGDRVVRLEGEALFKVRHLNRDTTTIKPGERFTAIAGDVSVEVLGTTFTIRERRGRVSVALLEGSVRVRGLVLHPGESVDIKGDRTRVVAVAGLDNPPQAWTAHKMVASGMTVQEIMEEYEDTYGYHIVLDNPALAAKRIDGTLSLDTEDNVLYMLANILNCNIDKQGKVIYLRSK
ncbi:FecR domain-containing protein [Dinghuibacter silviterrae]|uniref:FecR domain-containing protein n=1 Tax=Dinghuibacter silviterrae TaxID=1539049 RepID=UPI0013C2DE28|nr:FecR domain-containing protein [Dinghuibacter silviterrae]